MSIKSFAMDFIRAWLKKANNLLEHAIFITLMRQCVDVIVLTIRLANSLWAYLFNNLSQKDRYRGIVITTSNDYGRGIKPQSGLTKVFKIACTFDSLPDAQYEGLHKGLLTCYLNLISVLEWSRVISFAG